MSRISSVVSLSPNLVQLFNSLKEESEDTAELTLLKVVIDLETMHLVLDSKSSASLPITPETLKAQVSKTEPCFLFVKQGDKVWNFISWVPDTSLKVKQRMVYASGRNVLKDGFSVKLLANQYHFSAMLEFTSNGRSMAQERAPVKQLDRTTGLLKGKGLDEAERRSLMSRAELDREEAHKQEDQARDQMLEGMLGRTKLSSIQSGGFHQVNLPLTEQAESTVESFKIHQVHKFQISVSDKKDKLESKTLTDVVAYWEKSTPLDLDTATVDPKIYILRLGSKPKPEANTTTGSEEETTERTEEKDDTTNVLIYTCPPKSPPKLRMVYSTALSSLIDQLKQLQLYIHYKIEIFEDLAKANYTYATIYQKISNKDSVGVTKLQVDKQDQSSSHVNRIVQNSHQTAQNYREVQLPKFSKLPTHSVFGQPLPALANQATPIFKPKVEDFAKWPQN